MEGESRENKFRPRPAVAGEPITRGQARVGFAFNPSGSEDVNDIKASAAGLIDGLLDGMDESQSPEVKRVFATAATAIEDAAMWAVKAVTKQP